MGIFCGAVYAALVIAIFFGPERFHRALITLEDTTGKDEYGSDILVYEEQFEVVNKT